MAPQSLINNAAKSALKKTFSILIFVGLFYVLPLAAKPELLLNGKVIFLAFICSVLFITQPRLSFTESNQQKQYDCYTIWLIIAVSGFGQIASLIEWAYFNDHSTTIVSETINYQLPLGVQFPLEIEKHSIFDVSYLTLIGMTLILCGTFFRLHAIEILGKYFTATVQIKTDHQIIEAGPYKYLRHPSYTGAYLAMLGSALFLNSFAGIIILGIGMLFVYHARITAEEKALTIKFQEGYRQYSKRTWRMIPMIY